MTAENTKKNLEEDKIVNKNEQKGKNGPNMAGSTP
jgi:hypothetical protein